MLRLVLVEGSGTVDGAAFPTRFESEKRRVVVGRSTKRCDFAIRDKATSSLLSRAHAVLQASADGQWELSDLGSVNGTFVNHVRVKRARLREGDVLHFGIGANISVGDEAVPGPAIPAYRFHSVEPSEMEGPERSGATHAAPHSTEAADTADQGPVLPTLSQQSVPPTSARSAATATLSAGPPSAPPASEAVAVEPTSPGLMGPPPAAAPSPRKRPRSWDSVARGGRREHLRDVAVGADTPERGTPLPPFLLCPCCGLGLAGSLVLPCGHALCALCAVKRRERQEPARVPCGQCKGGSDATRPAYRCLPLDAAAAAAAAVPRLGPVPPAAAKAWQQRVAACERALAEAATLLVAGSGRIAVDAGRDSAERESSRKEPAQSAPVDGCKGHSDGEKEGDGVTPPPRSRDEEPDEGGSVGRQSASSQDRDGEGAAGMEEEEEEEEEEGGAPGAADEGLYSEDEGSVDEGGDGDLAEEEYARW